MTRIWTDEQLDAVLPVGRATHTGKYGWRRVNGCLNLGGCSFATEAEARQNRDEVCNDPGRWDDHTRGALSRVPADLDRAAALEYVRQTDEQTDAAPSIWDDPGYEYAQCVLAAQDGRLSASSVLACVDELRSNEDGYRATIASFLRLLPRATYDPKGGRPRFVAVRVDDENNAEEWWQAVGTRYPIFARSLRDHGAAVIEARLWDRVAALPGFSTGPKHAPTALLYLGDNGDGWADVVAGRHTVFGTLR